MNKDIQEAVEALMTYDGMREAGIDEKFAAMLARNMQSFENLPEEIRKRIADEYLAMAYELSNLEGIAKKHSDVKVRELAEWLKHINLLLAMSSVAKGEKGT